VLSYRHAFHAGNFADVVKHAVLTLLLTALARKDKPFAVIESHAGAGIYDLRAPQARKTREHECGVDLFWRRGDTPAALMPYREAIGAVNPELAPQQAPRFYPGSPLIVQRLLRTRDRLVLTELQQDESELLTRWFADDRRIYVYRREGFKALTEFLPPPERRGLVFVDPSYELGDEWQRVLAALSRAHRRWQTGVLAAWYPIQQRQTVDGFLNQLRTSGMRRILVTELCPLPTDVGRRLNGSGIVIVNPPWQIDERLREVLPWLHSVLDSQGRGGWRVEWLVPE
jgi:23S rRNA (adenine2030-N6)-methyltransferase